MRLARSVALAVPVVLAVVAAAPAGAADKCLTGDSILADRRGLAELRTATDECPCETARIRWLKCAKLKLGGLVGDGTIRRQCRGAAAAQLRATTCGTTKVACAERAPSPKNTVGCRVVPANACRDRRKVDAEPCAGETHCTDVVAWGNGTCLDPREPGPHPAGFRLVTYTKKSVVDPAADRALQTVVWYPAATAGPVNPTYRAIADAPAATGAFPLVVFSHGSCGYPVQSPFLTVHLATHGFVVAAVPHPGNMISEFPNCGLPAVQLSSAQERPADVRFVLDQLLAATADPGSPLFGLVDPARVGMMGHSFGGFTTHHATNQDARFKVAVPLAAAVIGSPPFRIPSLTMLGQIDSVVNNAQIRAAYAGSTAPKYLAEIQSAGHYAFSQACFPSADCRPPTTLTQDEAHALVLRYVVPFLHAHLAGNAAWAPLLAVPGAPGSVFERAP
jgi:predicted dienelactone hydrolase